MKEMSPASKSMSKDKKAEGQKAPLKPSGPANAGSGIPASAYNPFYGTFYMLDTISTSSASPIQSNGCFRNMDETDDHFGGALGVGVEYDSISNNGSWSGESEDHKEKMPNPPVRHEIIPGADNDKREKVRLKNERKHQRQKERRAQELHERCSGYLMSRKLEALAQQLVAMGFSHERATMALISNEGKVEESVAWLFEGGEDADKYRDENLGGDNLKIDISEELARIADMEIRFKCTKPEVERAVVTSEGDLDKAAEGLKKLKLEPPSVPLKPEGSGDPPTATNCKPLVVVSHNMGNQQPGPNPQLMNPQLTIQQRRDNKDFNYTKANGQVGGPLEFGSKNVQPLKKMQQKLEWAKPQQPALPADKKWTSAGPNASAAYSLASSSQVAPLTAKTETRYVGSEYKILQPAAVREPVIMMQRPQSVNTRHIPATNMSSSPPGTATTWYPTNSADVMKSNGLMLSIPPTGSLNPSNLNQSQMFHQLHSQQQQHFVPSSSPGDSPGTSRANGLWSRTGMSHTLAPASSLGLFTGLGSTGTSGASSPVDWSTAGTMAHMDYSNVDWSLHRGDLSSPRPSGLWMGPGLLKNDTQMYNSNGSNINMGVKLALRSVSNGSGAPISRLPDGGVASAETSAAGSNEWTSPFEGKDLFSLSRQFVSSPSL
uniref:UBA domain-containing protein n=1 Tax=Rhizophora mucronata TaxID=61149 RepID=A0A2P2L3D9_RHIMU